jgi:hypothetical protein
MTGRLKQLSGGHFCVEFQERGVYVTWKPVDKLNARKPSAWIIQDHPSQPQFPENMLRDIISSKSRLIKKPALKKTKSKSRAARRLCGKEFTT